MTKQKQLAMKTKEIDQAIKKFWKTTDNVVIAEMLGISEASVRRHAQKMGLPKKSVVKKVVPISLEKLGDELYKLLIKNKLMFEYEDLSARFGVSVNKIQQELKKLEKNGIILFYHKNGVEISDQIEKSEPTIIPQRALVGKRVKFGFVTDNHLGSKYERLDVLNALYDRFALDGITTVYNAGNVIDGEARFNKFDIHTYGMENQCKYFAEKYPQREGIKTNFITGDDHEGWYVQREGVNIGKFMEQKAKEAGRSDLVYLGHMEHDVILKAPHGQAVIRIVHPGGGSSYAISYTSQKLVESYSPGEKPNILLMGHYHKMEYNFIRGVYVVQGGCTMDQSPFMRKKRLDAHVGGWICEYQQADNGVILSFKAEWIPFYAKEFYSDNDIWKYQY